MPKWGYGQPAAATRPPDVCGMAVLTGHRVDYPMQVRQLDPEMAGGVHTETVPVQLLVLRRALGGDTVGLKR